MKTIRIILSSALLAFAVLVTNQATAQTATKQTAQPSAKAKALYGTWTFIGSETFSMPQDPNDKQKGDVLTLNADGTFRFVMDGTEHKGKFTIDASATWITLTDAATNEVFKLKVLEKTAKRLKVDYRDKDDVHNILIYEMK
ncbi:MAG: copper resistance protein NlpE [Bacteroidia bacterium]|jgi:VCBS repeat-containing protein|nr:copper resistance protein NlpE [Bacteroidia bacterium]